MAKKRTARFREGFNINVVALCPLILPAALSNIFFCNTCFHRSLKARSLCTPANASGVSGRAVLQLINASAGAKLTQHGQINILGAVVPVIRLSTVLAQHTWRRKLA